MAESFKFDLVSPERLLVSEEVESVIVPGREGEMTVLARHMPVMTTMRPGIVTVKTTDGRTERYVVYGGFVDKIPIGSAINRGLTLRMAQTPVQHYLPMLLERIERGDIDPSFVITHRAGLEDGPDLYKTFRDKKDGCIKVVLKP